MDRCLGNSRLVKLHRNASHVKEKNELHFRDDRSFNMFLTILPRNLRPSKNKDFFINLKTIFFGKRQELKEKFKKNNTLLVAEPVNSSIKAICSSAVKFEAILLGYLFSNNILHRNPFFQNKNLIPTIQNKPLV